MSHSASGSFTASTHQHQPFDPSEPRRCQSLTIPSCAAAPVPNSSVASEQAKSRKLPPMRKHSQIFLVRRGILSDFLAPPNTIRRPIKKQPSFVGSKPCADDSVEKNNVCSSEPLPCGSPAADEHPEGSGDHGPCEELRQGIVTFLHRRQVQIALLLLLLADIALVITEILILTHKEAFVTKSEDCTNTTEIERPAHNVYVPPYGCGVVVEVELSHRLHEAEFRLRWAGRSILFVFAVELLLMLFALGRGFFNVPNVLDVIVVFGSIAMEFTLTESENAATELIVFARCWRFLRIVHGCGLTVHEVEHELHEEDDEHQNKKEGEEGTDTPSPAEDVSGSQKETNTAHKPHTP